MHSQTPPDLFQALSTISSENGISFLLKMVMRIISLLYGLSIPPNEKYSIGIISLYGNCYWGCDGYGIIILQMVKVFTLSTFFSLLFVFLIKKLMNVFIPL
jgi:hypothetical protein